MVRSRSAVRARSTAIDKGRYRSGQTGQTVNLLAQAFVGSNPARPRLNSVIWRESMVYYTYILKSKNKDRYYIGHCKDITARLSQHNSCKVNSTKYGTPWEVIYFEEYDYKCDAYRRERQIKSYKGGQAFKALFQTVPPLAGCLCGRHKSVEEINRISEQSGDPAESGLASIRLSRSGAARPN